jgi:hypothetical protein
VDFANQLSHRSPTGLPSDLGTHFKVDSGNEEVTAGLHQTRQASQASFCFCWLYVAKESIRNHNILKTELINQLRIAGIANAPSNVLTERWPDPRSPTVAFEHGGYLI